MIKSISIILPLYNEAQRLKKTFKEIKKFLKRKTVTYVEVIFVNDGSKDNSDKMIKKFIKENKKMKFKFKYFSLNKNSGKGAALKMGVKKATKDWILTSDIDFSVSLFELHRWIRNDFINHNHSIYFASRSHRQSKVDSKFYRKIAGNFLSFLIYFTLSINIKDTQCGFKLYRSSIAKKVFSKIKFVGYEHDIEIVLLSKKLKERIVELPVTWKHVKLSKVNILADSIKMFFKVFLIKIRHQL